MTATGYFYHGQVDQVEGSAAFSSVPMSPAEAVAELRWRWETFSERVSRPEECVYCGYSVVWWNGSRTRTATVLVIGVVEYLTGIRCQRVRCGSRECGRSWTLRPEGMTPRRHFQLSVVSETMAEYVLGGESSQEQLGCRYGCSRWTVGQWLRWVSGVAEPSVVAKLVLDASEEPVLPRVEVVIRRRWERVRSLVRRAAENVALLETLASVHGLDPPGLSSVVEWLVRGRDRVTTYVSPAIPELSR